MMSIALRESTLVRIKDEEGRTIQLRVAVMVDGLWIRRENESEYHGPLLYSSLYGLACGVEAGRPKQKLANSKPKSR
jgi:hypothetical protein